MKHQLKFFLSAFSISSSLLASAAGALDHSSSEPLSAKATDDTTKLGVAAGIGYQWDYNIGTEARWLHSSVSRSFKADSVQAAVTFRF